jgi:hypothetical protein
MPIRIDPPIGRPPGRTGRWIASLQDDLPCLYAHAGLGTPPDDPITVFWGGNTSGDQLLEFFAQSAGCSVGRQPPTFSSSIFNTVCSATTAAA